MITITDSAKKRINEILNDNHDRFVRLTVDSGGCNGFSYNFTIDKRNLDDVLVEKVIIDPVSLDILENFEVDFVDDLTGSYFRLNVEKATSSCGCGTSFSI